MTNQEEIKTYIRFGVHKDRDVLQNCADDFNGIVIPAHILAYSPEPTVAMITYISKSYFIDPMTYIYKYNYKSYITHDKDKKKKFKPSIHKLTESYNLTDFFITKDFAPLRPADFTDQFIKKLLSSTINFQKSKVNQTLESSIKRYEDLLKKINIDYPDEAGDKDYEPLFYTLPYFDFNDHKDDWFEINKRIFEISKANFSDSNPVPILAFKKSALDEYKQILAPFKDAPKLLFWIDNFDERKSDCDTLKKYRNFVQYAAYELGISITNLYGSYYSLLLTKLGLKGVSHGIYYGESKSIKTEIGGIPPSRYYIEPLHGFLTIPSTIALIKESPELLCDCENVCKEFVAGDIERIYEFDKNYDRAQRHFLCMRQREIKDIRDSDLNTLFNNLNKTYQEYKDKVSLPQGNTFLTDKGIDYIKNWSLAIQDKCNEA